MKRIGWDLVATSLIASAVLVCVLRFLLSHPIDASADQQRDAIRLYVVDADTQARVKRIDAWVQKQEAIEAEKNRLIAEYEKQFETDGKFGRVTVLPGVDR